MRKHNRKARLHRLPVNFQWEGIFANPFEFVGSGRGYRMSGYHVVGMGAASISSSPPGGFSLPCGDYKAHRR